MPLASCNHAGNGVGMTKVIAFARQSGDIERPH